MQRTITRQWRGSGAHVSTEHPQLGTVRRGHISAAQYGRTSADPQARAVWRVTDHEGIGLDDVTGDYLDAEAALLAATAWADEPVDPAELDD